MTEAQPKGKKIAAAKAMKSFKRVDLEGKSILRLLNEMDLDLNFLRTVVNDSGLQTESSLC